jgi:hypothetical protein
MEWWSNGYFVDHFYQYSITPILHYSSETGPNPLAKIPTRTLACPFVFLLDNNGIGQFLS